jgi:hypothetical protein
LHCRGGPLQAKTASTVSFDLDKTHSFGFRCRPTWGVSAGLREIAIVTTARLSISRR